MSHGGPLDIFVLKDRIQAAGATVRFVQDDVPEDDLGDVYLTLQAWKEAKDRDQIVRQTQAGLRERVQVHGKPLAGWKPPYGYRWVDPDAKHGKSRLALDPEAAPVVRMIFDWALAGMPLRSIVAALAERGIPSPTGKPRWHPTPLRELLRRPIYTGTGVAYRMRCTRSAGHCNVQRPRPPEEQVQLPGIAPAIVTPEEQAAVLARLTFNQMCATRRSKHPEATLLRAGFIRCGHCGRSMSAEWRDDCGPLYQCPRANRGRDACGFPSILAKSVDSVVWAKVETILRDPTVVAREVERRREDGTLDWALAGLESRLAAIERKQANTARAIAAINDDAAAAPLLIELKALAEQKTAAEKELARMRQRIADRAAEDARVMSLAAHAAKVSANIETMTYDDKRLALTWLGVQARVWKPGHVDEAGEPLRWELTIAPLDEEPIVFRTSRGGACPARRSPKKY